MKQLLMLLQKSQLKLLLRHKQTHSIAFFKQTNTEVCLLAHFSAFIPPLYSWLRMVSRLLKQIQIADECNQTARNGDPYLMMTVILAF